MSEMKSVMADDNETATDRAGLTAEAKEDLGNLHAAICLAHSLAHRTHQRFGGFDDTLTRACDDLTDAQREVYRLLNQALEG